MRSCWPFWPIPPTPNTPNGSMDRQKLNPDEFDLEIANTVLAAKFSKK